MTEKEWLADVHPNPMLEYLRGNTSERKLRLFACACCRRIWDLLIDVRSRTAIEVAELYADGNATGQERIDAENAARDADAELAVRRARHSIDGDRSAHENAAIAASIAAGNAYLDAVTTFVESALDSFTECHWQAAVLHDLFGNPFRPFTIDPRWLTISVVDLSTAIYDEKAFDRMPILADALMDSGCDNDDIIAHCRSEGPHVRGCWVLDLLLAKE